MGASPSPWQGMQSEGWLFGVHNEAEVGTCPHALLSLFLTQVEFGDRLTLAASSADPASLNANLLTTWVLAEGPSGAGRCRAPFSPHLYPSVGSSASPPSRCLHL